MIHISEDFHSMLSGSLLIWLFRYVFRIFPCKHRLSLCMFLFPGNAKKTIRLRLDLVVSFFFKKICAKLRTKSLLRPFHSNFDIVWGGLELLTLGKIGIAAINV